MALTTTEPASGSEAMCDYTQKNAHRVHARRARPTKATRQIPKLVKIERSITRGGRFITSSSWGSKEITRPNATDVTMLTQSTCGAVIGMVKPKKMATAMTSAWATFVGSMKRIAFSMLL